MFEVASLEGNERRAGVGPGGPEATKQSLASVTVRTVTECKVLLLAGAGCP